MGPFRRHGGVCHPFAFSEQKRGDHVTMVGRIVGGVDTPADSHVAAAVDANGGILGCRVVPS